MADKNPYLQLQRGTRSETSAEKFSYSYYDRMKLNTSTREFRLFQRANGNNGVTGADTNMTNAGMVPNGKKFVCTNFKFSYTGMKVHAGADVVELYKLLENTTGQIIIDGKQDIGTWKFTELFGNVISFYCYDANATNNPFSALSSTSIFRGQYQLKIPITLAALQTFEFKVIHHDAINSVLNDDYIDVYFNGIMKSLN